MAEIRIQPASLAQVQRGKGGRLVAIEDDVGGIAAQMKEIDPNLNLYWNEEGEFFVIKEMCPDGKEREVNTCTELDKRLLERLRYISSGDWDVVAEMERMDRVADAAVDYRLHEEVGPRAERLAHALRKDLNPGKIIVPRGLDVAH